MKAAANDKYILFPAHRTYPAKKYLQLQGIMQINNANIPNLLTPLMCLVDYKVYIHIHLLPTLIMCENEKSTGLPSNCHFFAPNFS